MVDMERTRPLPAPERDMKRQQAEPLFRAPLNRKERRIALAQARRAAAAERVRQRRRERP